METGSTVFILLTLLAATAAFLLTAIGVFICSYLRELSALKEELRRTADEGKYCLGIRELRRKYLKRLPFITEKNLSRVYRRIFRSAPRAKSAGGGIWSSLAPSMLGIFICASCLCGVSWAWFNASVVSETGVVRSASYTVSVAVTSGSESVEVNFENGRYTATLDTGEYNVTVTPTGSTKNGYCTVGFGGKEYCAVSKNGDTAITFTIKTEAGGILTLEPHWGTPDESANKLDGIIEDVGTENN